MNAWDGMSWSDALRLKAEAEADPRFYVKSLGSHWSLEAQAQVWYLEIRFQYFNARKSRCRITGTIHSRDRWEAFRTSCLEHAAASLLGAKAPGATAQRRMAGNSRPKGANEQSDV